MRALFLAVGAAAALGLFTAGASARNLSLSSQTFRAGWREVSFEASFGRTTCQVTLEGSMHSRTLPKITGLLVGYVTSARLGPCPMGSATILRETLPWHVQYQSFSGTLPNITNMSLNVINVSIAVKETFGITCLGRSTLFNEMLFALAVHIGIVTGAFWGGTIPSGPECFNQTITLSSGEGRTTVLNGTAAISIRLI
jgi:hypothetical protein